MQGMEGIGEAVTGGLAARAVEPHAGEQGHTHETACLNCGTALVGDYCHRCGQHAHVHRTLGAFWHDLLHGVLHFEGKIWRTLPILAFRPGELTRRYIAWERARFVTPLALFHFSVFLMFAVLSISGATMMGPELSEAMERDAATELRKSEETIARLDAERTEAARAGRSTDSLDQQIAEARMEREAAAAGGTFLGGDGKLTKVDIKTGWARLDQGIAKANKNPSLLLYKLQANAYKFSWALIPLSAPFVWLMFLHRRRYRAYGAYDHVVFVTYSIAFMSLGSILLLLLSMIGVTGGWIFLATILVPPIHIYKQLKGAYGLSRRSALWRTFILLLFVSFTITLFFLLLLTLGVLG